MIWYLKSSLGRVLRGWGIDTFVQLLSVSMPHPELVSPVPQGCLHCLLA